MSRCRSTLRPWDIHPWRLSRGLRFWWKRPWPVCRDSHTGTGWISPVLLPCRTVRRVYHRIHARSRSDEIGSMQNDDGSFNWSKKTAPFLEDVRRYIIMLVALGATCLHEDYLKTPAAAGFKELSLYLTTTQPTNQHDEPVLMRAAESASELMSPIRKRELISETLALQLSDGGWSLVSLGDWARIGGEPNDKNGPSDGYGTGLVLFLLSLVAAISLPAFQTLAYPCAGSRATESGRSNDGRPRRRHPPLVQIPRLR
jgi:hypothetical protein